jgi:hypothetical protein
MKRKGSFLVASAIILVLFFSSLSFGAEELKTTGPYDSLRDYIAALEARGRVLRVKEVDQDNYEGTALVFRLIDEYGADCHWS